MSLKCWSLFREILPLVFFSAWGLRFFLLDYTKSVTLLVYKMKFHYFCFKIVLLSYMYCNLLRSSTLQEVSSSSPNKMNAGMGWLVTKNVNGKTVSVNDTCLDGKCFMGQLDVLSYASFFFLLRTFSPDSPDSVGCFFWNSDSDETWKHSLTIFGL